MNAPALSTAPSAGLPVARTRRPASDTRIKAAFVLYVTEQGDALFTRRSSEANHPGEWDLPGGGVDEGESDEEAARRESEEEIGVDPGALGDPIDAQADEDGVDATTFLHVTRRFIPRLNPNEHDKYIWAPLSDPPEPLHDGVTRTLHAQKALGNLGEDGFLPRREGSTLPTPRQGKPHMEPLPRPGPHTSTNVKNYDEAGVSIDREHDGPWLSAMSKDRQVVYVNKSLPHYVDIDGVSVNVDEWLTSHEVPERDDVEEQLAALDAPDEETRIKVYETAHERSGTPSEKRWAEERGINWDKLQAWARGKEAAVEKGPHENEPGDVDVKPARCHAGELAATDALSIALDRASVRDIDLDGRMHVGISNISKANICPYRGREIPGYEELGLEADEVYQLYRHPAELERAAPTFNRVQLLRRHVPVSADDHRPYDVVGTTGSDASFENPYLRISLTIWEQKAIDAVMSGDKRELSCGYHYRADMTPGVTPEGEEYDGVMRDIVGNHVAIVEDGRAGPDVVVGDSAEAVFRGSMTADDSHSRLEGNKMTAKTPTKFANLALQLTARGLRPILAQDAKLNLMPLFADLTSKNFPARKAALVKALEKETKGKLAKDANLSHITEMLDHLEHPSSDESVSGAQHRAMAAAAEGHSNLGIPQSVGEEFRHADRGKSFADALPDFLRGKGLDEESIKEACDMAFGSAKGKDEEKNGELTKALVKHELSEHAGEDEFPPKKEEDDDEDKDDKDAKDNLPAHEGTVAAMTGDSKKGFVDQKAFDAALDAATKQIRKEVRQNEREIRMALDEVRPYVGELRGAEYETPKQVYAAALKTLGMDAAEVDTLNRSAMRIVLKHMPKPGSRQQSEPRIAQDASDSKSYDEMFPGVRGRSKAA